MTSLENANRPFNYEVPTMTPALVTIDGVVDPKLSERLSKVVASAFTPPVR
jgi:hypothetical protein